VISRWVNEVQVAVSSESPMVQYHALGLLCHIKEADRLATQRIAHKHIKSGLHSPLALCYLIRVVSTLAEESGNW